MSVPQLSESRDGQKRNSKRARARMACYVLVLLAVAAWKYAPRPWHATLILESPHYRVYSTATPEQTRRMADGLELLYGAYSNRFLGLPGFSSVHPKLKLKLFKDRREMRWVNPNLGWAEAFYRSPFCYAYYAADEPNPCSWMLHEGVHQLNHEVGHLHLGKWLEEGLACYFSTSLLESNALRLGEIDSNTYPAWWLSEIATSPELSQNLTNGSLIPLRAIITNRGGPSMRTEFNLYYLHWWTLTHFVFENPKYASKALGLVQAGGGFDSFQAMIGPIERVQTEWHAYVRELKMKVIRDELERMQRKMQPTRAHPL